MELIARVIEQDEPRSVQYQARTGETKTFKAVGMSLRYGRETLYAEATYELADTLEANPLEPGTLCCVTVSFRSNSYRAADGVTRYATDVRLLSISAL